MRLLSPSAARKPPEKTATNHLYSLEDRMPKSKIEINDLIKEGLIKIPTSIFGIFEGRRVEAKIKNNGIVEYKDKEFVSLSMAAGVAITSVSGKKAPGREYYSINGWNFWIIENQDGKLMNLSKLRKKSDENG